MHSLKKAIRARIKLMSEVEEKHFPALEGLYKNTHKYIKKHFNINSSKFFTDENYGTFVNLVDSLWCENAYRDKGSNCWEELKEDTLLTTDDLAGVIVGIVSQCIDHSLINPLE